MGTRISNAYFITNGCLIYETCKKVYIYGFESYYISGKAPTLKKKVGFTMFMTMCNILYTKVDETQKWVWRLIYILKLPSWRKEAFDTLKKVDSPNGNPHFYTFSVT